MQASMHLQHDGPPLTELGAVGSHHYLEICAGCRWKGSLISIQLTRAQLEGISATINTYLRSLDPPEAPLPDRDPTAPQEEFPPPIPKASYHESLAGNRDDGTPPHLCHDGSAVLEISDD